MLVLISSHYLCHKGHCEEIASIIAMSSYATKENEPNTQRVLKKTPRSFNPHDNATLK